MAETEGAGEGAPLTTLLSRAWIAFTIEADNAVEAVGSERVGRLFRISLPMWANGLRFIDAEGITVGDAGGGRREGYGSHRGVTSGTVLRATRAGAYARRLWPDVVAGIEQRWRDRCAFATRRPGRVSRRKPWPWPPATWSATAWPSPARSGP